MPIIIQKECVKIYLDDVDGLIRKKRIRSIHWRYILLCVWLFLRKNFEILKNDDYSSLNKRKL